MLGKTQASPMVSRTTFTCTRWRDLIAPEVPPASHPIIGVFEGEGIGPEIIRATLRVLAALEQQFGFTVEVREGGPIGTTAEARWGRSLPNEAVEFCEQIFREGGAILAGPGGGRFVYELRRQFGLFCKLSPVRVSEVLIGAGCFRDDHARGTDIIFVRENCGGVYQGDGRIHTRDGRRWAEHQFRYDEADVERLLEVAARIARCRSGRLQVVVKEGGVPSVTELWADVAERVAARHGLELELINADFAVYRVVRHPLSCDVVASPNLLGDMLADVAGVLVGSRGVTYGASFALNGAAVYQTNHGAAKALAGSNRANPVGQMMALAMLLHESFGLTEAAKRVESAIESVWQAGWATADLAAPGWRVVGTNEFGDWVVRALCGDEVPAAVS